MTLNNISVSEYDGFFTGFEGEPSSANLHGFADISKKGSNIPRACLLNRSPVPAMAL